MIRITPRVDFAFRKLFGSEESNEILMSLINSIISQKDKLMEIEIINPYKSNFDGEQSLTVTDVKGKTVEGKRLNIQIQILDLQSFAIRSVAYWAKLFADQRTNGVTYGKFCKTICINILNFSLLPETEYHNIYKIQNTKSGIELLDECEIHFIELSKFDDKLTTMLDKWLKFLINPDYYAELLKQAEPAPDSSVQDARNYLDNVVLTIDEKNRYEDGLKWLRDEDGALESANFKGKAEGLKEGVKQTAKNLREMGAEIELIIQATGLSRKDIELL